jgi:GGDEF domain-containing protein
VLLYDCSLGGAEIWAERFRAALADLAVPGLLTSVTASFGVAACRPRLLLDRAERACAQAKPAGRDRVVSATVVSPRGGAPTGSTRRVSVLAARDRR